MLEEILNFSKGFIRTAVFATTVTAAVLTSSCTKIEDEFKPEIKMFDGTGYRWIGYSPTNYNPNTGTYPSESSIREDLNTLIEHGYNSIITYGSSNILGDIPRIAKDAGFKGVIMGIWDLKSSEEFDNAVCAKNFVDGYCEGNEGLESRRYELGALEKAADSLRNITRKPVTTSEPISSYDESLLEFGDWIFPNVHPYWSNVKEPINAAVWTKKQYDELSATTDKIVVFKEVGLPSAGDNSASEKNQNIYYNALDSLMNNGKVTFAYFEAFDQPWKNNLPVEPHWGLFHEDRQPKEAGTPQIVYTYVPKIGSFKNLYGKVRNVKPENHRLTSYLYANGSWYVKPYYSNPLTKILSDGSWVTDITTGGIDEQLSPVYTFLVTSDFQANNYNPNTLPPNKPNDKVLAHTIVHKLR